MAAKKLRGAERGKSAPRARAARKTTTRRGRRSPRSLGTSIDPFNPDVIRVW